MSRKKAFVKPAVLLATGLLVFNTAIPFTAAAELSLDDSIALALQNNPSIKMAIADKDKAVWGIKENEGGKMPNLSLSNSNNRSGGEATSTGENFNTSLRVNWPLYTGGRTEGLIDQAKYNANIATVGVAKVKEQVKLDTTTAYFSVLQNNKLVTVNQQTVDNLSEHLKNVQAQYEVGTIAKSDVLRSEVELANAQQNLTKAQNAYDVSVATFNNIIGLPLDSQNTMKDDLAFSQYDMSLEDSIQMAKEKRPEIMQSQDTINAAKAGIKVADSGKLPTVSANGTQGWSGSKFPGDNSNWTVGLSASWDIFDAGVTNAKIKEAQANMEKVSHSDQQTRTAVELEVRQAYLSMKEAEARIETSKVAVGKANEDLKASQAKYYAGVGTNLDVIDAQVALTQAETNATQAVYDYSVNKANLQKAIGAGVE
ncbi:MULTISPECIES: TolC family protein [Pelosinus]|uniref:Outer membrane efflux protein n=1 Tax=Pelosinus fermentans B4 TaxID=1149862 RepID=I9LIJ3_9FIRM|nr:MULTISPECIES: TolC family protein [Pelosinus]EIW20221.1 outer membrane efflux protein [Pelosinus fermentans B4]EIW25941.1 outer membrane efflux protein [Pelosinus fermentans A11]OAM93239.1 outer membrane efflux protein [Pelosinus fermentans DSM 17108]SDQ71331.1 type I secretion outer membrane protein, TolC family [Pelosinus fermentans]